MLSGLRKSEKTQTRVEEIFNSLTHIAGVGLSITALVLLIVFSVRYGSAKMVAANSIYGATLIILYLASSIYHAAPRSKTKKILEAIDHSCIYLLIAGTYTPFTLLVLPGAWGWSLFGAIWGIALIGVIFKARFTGRFELISLLSYLLMGWIVIIAINPLIHNIPMGGLIWLVLGGLCYTIGAIFYALDTKFYFSHVIWHVFVLAGSICHFFSIFFYVVLVHK
jgi:hemolysin III